MTDTQMLLLKANFDKNFVKGWDELLVKLKQHGGEMMVPQPEPEIHVAWLLREGQIFDSTKLNLVPGEPNSCHLNSGRLWAHNEELQIMIGYVLCDDGELWRQHTWLINSRTSELIETISPAKKYFGVMLSDEQALKFAFDNAPEVAAPATASPRIRRIAFEVVRGCFESLA